MSLGADALVLDARLRQSLVAIRSLGRRGLSVAALDTMPDVPAFRSRWCQRAFVCPAPEATLAYVSYLEQLLDGTRPPVLIASHDGTIAVLRAHRERLESRARLALAREPAMAIAVSKERTLAAARLIGVTVPRSISLTNVGDVPAALKEIGLPAVVKPTESWLSNGRSAIRIGPQLVTTIAEARRAVADVQRYEGVALFQALLTGRREAVSFLYANGQVHARFAQWAKRMNPPLGGDSTLRQSIPVPADIGAQAERLVRAIGLEGYSEVEFRRDAAGHPFLMEINPRLSASVEIAVRSGVDFPHLLCQWARGDAIDRVDGYRAGTWMRYLRGDVMTTVAAFEQRGRPGVTAPWRAAVAFGLTFLQPMSYDCFDWQDSRPAVKAMADLTRDLARGAAKRARRSTTSGRRKRLSWE